MNLRRLMTDIGAPSHGCRRRSYQVGTARRRRFDASGARWWRESVAVAMGAVGSAALTANAISFGILWFHRMGDSNMRSAWICTRNDVLGNLAVLLAALGVFGTGTGWPDLVVAATMATLALQGASTVLRQSLGELGQRRPTVVPTIAPHIRS